LTATGSIKIQVPKVRDRNGTGIKFNSTLVPPYVTRSKSVEDFIPWLYLKGISTGDMADTLHNLLGAQAKSITPDLVRKLKACWLKEHEEWSKRKFNSKKYVYIWADGVYSHVRLGDKLCLLVIVGVTASGHKELIAVHDGVRESEQSWREVLIDLQSRGLTAPKLAIGDGAMGFWLALTKIFPQTQKQRCWFHKMGNIVEKFPKAMQDKVVKSLQSIWMAETKESASKAYRQFITTYGDKYPKAVACLEKDEDELLAFYDFPALHWAHIRTTNPIESMFATIRQRSTQTKNCGSRDTTLMMVFKLAETAQGGFRRLRGFSQLAEIIQGVQFKDGIRVADEEKVSA
jgi:putative transposase